MQNCLKGVMINGTGRELVSSQFSIAGKTGTARLLNENKEYVDENQSDFQASFAGYFPANNPKYTCVVVVTRPKIQVYAAKVAGPVFVAIANKIYASNLAYHPAINERKKLSKSLPVIKSGSNKAIVGLLKKLAIPYKFPVKSNWISADTVRNSLFLKPIQMKQGVVPNIIGMSAKDAVFLLESNGLSVNMLGHGKVKSQSLAVGTEIHKGQVVKIVLE